MPITTRRIFDQKSFTSTTEHPRQTAALYFYKQLDPIYDAVTAISHDLFARPQLYTNIHSADAINSLAKLNSRVGSDEFIPSRDQRLLIYQPIFGPPDTTANFDKLRDDLIAAATAFAERVFDTGVEMLRERVRTAHRPLKEFLIGLTGDSIVWSTQNALPGIAEQISFKVLRVPGVCSVFGINSAPSNDWPYSEDSNADKLLEEVCARIGSPGLTLTRQEVSNRQRTAARGAEALAAVIDYTENAADPKDDNASLDVLITTCYTWGAAKKALAS